MSIPTNKQINKLFADIANLRTQFANLDGDVHRLKCVREKLLHKELHEETKLLQKQQPEDPRPAVPKDRNDMPHCIVVFDDDRSTLLRVQGPFDGYWAANAHAKWYRHMGISIRIMPIQGPNTKG